MATVRKNRITDDIISRLYSSDSLTSDFDVFNEFINLADTDGRTLLIHAVLTKNLDLVSWLIAKGASIEHQDKLGWTALHYVINTGQASILKVLLSVHSAIDLQDKYGNTPLWRATFESKGREDLIKPLLQTGANPYVKNNSGISPYDLALAIANYDVKSLFTDFI